MPHSNYLWTLIFFPFTLAWCHWFYLYLWQVFRCCALSIGLFDLFEIFRGSISNENKSKQFKWRLERLNLPVWASVLVCLDDALDNADINSMDFLPTSVHCKSCIQTLCPHAQDGNGPNIHLDSNMITCNLSSGTDLCPETAMLPPQKPMIYPVWYCCWTGLQNCRLTEEKTKWKLIHTHIYYYGIQSLIFLFEGPTNSLHFSTYCEIQNRSCFILEHKRSFKLLIEI